MRINTNMAALNAWRSLETNQTNLQKSLGRLSSGYRINTAADDAAGLAVSEKMNAQTRGIAMATRNAQDAVSLMQTAEGGASNIQNMLQRMRELAVQASSDTLQDTDRAQLQQEFSALQSEIDRTAGSVTFNGRKLINGLSGDNVSATGTGVTNASVIGTLTGAGSYTVKVTTAAAAQTKESAAFSNVDATVSTLNDVDANLVAGDLLILSQNSKSVALDVGNKAQTVAAFITASNTALANAGMTARMKWDATNKKIELDSNVVGTAGNVTVTEKLTGAGFVFADTTAGADAAVSVVDNATGLAPSGATFSYAGATVTGTAGALKNVKFTAGALNATATVTTSQNGLTFQVGANQNETISASLGNLTATNLNVDASKLNIGDKASATAAIDGLDTALNTVSTERAKMGAMQNRLDNAVSSLQTQNENLTAANSRIRDVDMASEMANFTKFQVLSQASTAMMAQANQLSQGILTLLR